MQENAWWTPMRAYSAPSPPSWWEGLAPPMNLSRALGLSGFSLRLSPIPSPNFQTPGAKILVLFFVPNVLQLLTPLAFGSLR